ncbi:MAG: Fic family protein [Clostridia bacterium]
MRKFDYKNLNQNLFKPEIIKYLTQIHEYKGKQELYIEADSGILVSMMEIAKIQSTGASNRIEGIQTSDKRLRQIVQEKIEPKNRSEQEIAGYREVLKTIHESYVHIAPKPNIILQLHRDLYVFSESSIGGNWKNSDNIIEEIDTNGFKQIRFKPLSAFATPTAIEDLCDAFQKAIDENIHDPLILIPMFVLDFLCIHPFNDGNGRISRLLTLLLLYRAGYIVGKYISIEQIIEKTKESYYDVLQECSADWHEGRNKYGPFVEYYLGIILSAYREFTYRVAHLKYRNLSKPDRIKKIITGKIGKFTRSDLLDLAPDISESTMRKTLGTLLSEGYIIKIGATSNAEYIKNSDY